MLGLGDGIVVILASVALIYGIYMAMTRNLPLYFKLSVAAVACLLLGYIFDICYYIVHGYLEEGYMIGYLGSIGSFFFLLTASVGYMDGIIDDGTPKVKKCRYIAFLGPAVAFLFWIPNMFADAPVITKVVYSILWIPAMVSVYFNLKHAIVPDMGFGFVKAIRPFNVAALSFSFLQLIHLTLWNFCEFWGWMPLAVSGFLFGVACIVMVVMADRGVKKWTL